MTSKRLAVAAAVAACFGAPALANPTNPAVIHGAAAFAQTGNVLTVTNAPNTIINWGGFSIGVNEITRFVQQSANSAVLNRVIGRDPSAILGSLQSNGRVFLINPNGIVFGPGSQVDVAGLVASTLNLGNEDFLAGRLRFTDGALAGTVRNQGQLTGGTVYLVGRAVANEGIITSPRGEVVLAAGQSVELVDPATPNLRVEVVAPDNEARNLGTISAQAGRIGIYAGLITNSGTVRADTVAQENGRILLKATRRVELTDGSVLSAAAPAVGNTGGDGGFIETSAEQVRIADGAAVTTKAAQGRTGTWLIDPTDFTIAASGGDITGALLSDQLDDNNITLQTVASGGGNGDLFVNDAVAWTSGNTLTLNAHRNIDFTGGGVLDGGTTGNVMLNAGQGGTSGAIVAHPSNIIVTGDTLTASALTGIGSSANPLRAQVANAALVNTQVGGVYFTNTGDVTVAARSANGDISIITTDGAFGHNDSDGKRGWNIAVGTVGGLGGLEATDSSSSGTAGNIALRAGNGGDTNSANFGGDGGSITLDAPVTGRSVTLRGGDGGDDEDFGDGTFRGGTGAIALNALLTAGESVAMTGGGITLNAALSAGESVTMTGGATLNAALTAGESVAITGGSITINAPLSAGESVTLTAGSSTNSAGGSVILNSGSITGEGVTVTAGDGADAPTDTGIGRDGGDIVLGAFIFDSDTVTLNAGNGGTAVLGRRGAGGSIVVNGPVQFTGDATLRAGDFGIGDTGRLGREITGTAIDLTAAGSLAIVNAIGINPTGGDVSLRAGMAAGNVLSSNLAIVLANPASDSLTLRGHALSLAGSYAANTLTIETAGAIGSAGTPLQASANALALHGSDVFVTNNKAVTVEAGSTTGAFFLNNGANDITLAGAVSAGATGDAIRIAGRKFVNQAGANALSAPNGRWIVWSQSPLDNVFGGLQSGNTAVWNTAFNAGSPTLAETGNRFAFSAAPPAGIAAIRADDQTKTYGDTFAGFTYSAFAADGGSAFGDAFTDPGSGAVTLIGVPVLASAGAADTATRTGGNAGGAAYDITVDLAGVTAPGFTLQGVNGLLTVNPRAITVAADAKGLTYGDAAVPLTFTAGNLASFDSNATAFTGALARATGINSTSGNEAAGSYAIGQGTLAANANYSLTGFTGANYVIAPRALTVTAAAQDKVYDGNAAATVTFGDNRISGDVLTASGVAAFTDKNADTGKTVNVTGIGIGGADAANYAVNATATATADVTPRTLVVTYGGVDKVYDATTGAIVTASDDRVAGDALTVDRTAAFLDKNAGEGKTVNVNGVSLSGADADNYTVAATGSTTADIAPAPLIVHADDKSRTFGDPNPPFSVSLSGFVGGEGPGVLTGAPTLTTPATLFSPPGAYAITVMPGGFNAPNYAVQFIDGSLLVMPPGVPPSVINDLTAILLVPAERAGDAPVITPAGAIEAPAMAGTGTDNCRVISRGLIICN